MRSSAAPARVSSWLVRALSEPVGDFDLVGKRELREIPGRSRKRG